MMNKYQRIYMRRLYMKGVSRKEIANQLGLTKGQIDWIIQKDRKRFPYRRPHRDSETKAKCIADVKDGMPPKAAARKYDVHVNTVRRWCKNAEAGMAEKT